MGLFFYHAGAKWPGTDTGRSTASVANERHYSNSCSGVNIACPASLTASALVQTSSPVTVTIKAIPPCFIFTSEKHLNNMAKLGTKRCQLSCRHVIVVFVRLFKQFTLLIVIGHLVRQVTLLWKPLSNVTSFSFVFRLPPSQAIGTGSVSVLGPSDQNGSR